MICKQCGNPFVALSVNQIYCSKSCGNKYRRKHSIQDNYPVIEFNCSKCGRHVITDGTPKDKRTRFCSHECEKAYWRHPPYEHDTSLTNFHSVGEYLSWERRTNE